MGVARGGAQDEVQPNTEAPLCLPDEDEWDPLLLYPVPPLPRSPDLSVPPAVQAECSTLTTSSCLELNSEIASEGRGRHLIGGTWG